MDTLTNNLQVNFICEEGDALISGDLNNALADLGNLNSGEFVDLIFEQATLTSEVLYPVKTRAIRRKQTAVHHNRLEKIADRYPIKDSNKHNLKKAVKSNKAWYVYDDSRKDITDKMIAEGMADYEYQCRVDEFYKLVEQYNSTDDEKFFFYPDECFPFDDDMPEFVDEKKYPFDNMSDVAKAIWDFFN